MHLNIFIPSRMYLLYSVFSMINISDFEKVELRVGRIIVVDDVEGAKRPIYRLSIDFGTELGVRTIAAGIKHIYLKEELLNKRVVCVMNLEPKRVAGIESQGMILAAGEGENIAIISPERDVAEGSRVHCRWLYGKQKAAYRHLRPGRRRKGHYNIHPS